jgi:hypothetical protein
MLEVYQPLWFFTLSGGIFSAGSYLQSELEARLLFWVKNTE